MLAAQLGRLLKPDAMIAPALQADGWSASPENASPQPRDPNGGFMVSRGSGDFRTCGTTGTSGN
jgi:hypothetical protein